MLNGQFEVKRNRKGRERETERGRHAAKSPG